jgi:hypothetical protein
MYDVECHKLYTSSRTGIIMSRIMRCAAYVAHVRKMRNA